MKKTIALITIIAVLLCSCTVKITKNGDISQKDAETEDIHNGENGDIAENIAYLDAPEITASENMSQFTVNSVLRTEEKGFSGTQITHGFDKEGGRTRYYRKTAEVGKPIYKEICDILQGDKAKYYKNTDGKYTKSELPKNSEKNADSYFAKDYGIYGIGYKSRYSDAKFVKKEDCTNLGKSCYGYELYGRDNVLGKDIKAKISVDKETGLWLYLSCDEYEMSVVDFAFDGHGVPGAVPVKLADADKALYSDNNILITAKKISFDDPNNAAVVTMTVANSNNFAVRIISESFSVNGICIGGSIVAQECPAYGKTEIIAQIPNSSLENCGIDFISDMEMKTEISTVKPRLDEKGNIWYEDANSQLAKGEKLVLKTDCTEAEKQKNRNITAGKNLISADTVKVSYVSLVKDEEGGFFVKLYTENTDTSDNLRIRVNLYSVNGKKTDISGNIITYKGTKAYNRIHISRQRLDELGIKADDITKIAFETEVYRGESMANTQSEAVKRTEVTDLGVS